MKLITLFVFLTTLLAFNSFGQTLHLYSCKGKNMTFNIKSLINKNGAQFTGELSKNNEIAPQLVLPLKRLATIKVVGPQYPKTSFAGSITTREADGPATTRLSETKLRLTIYQAFKSHGYVSNLELVVNKKSKSIAMTCYQTR